MAAIRIAKNQVLYEAGAPITALYLVLEGSFSISFPGGFYTLTSGEVAGICEIIGDSHIVTCTALEDSSILSYPISDISALESFFKDSLEHSVGFTRSAFHQINVLLRLHEMTHFHCNDLYTNCSKDYAFYLACALRNQIKTEKLPAVSSLSPVTSDALFEDWVPSYYAGFENLLSGKGSAHFAKEPSVPAGLIAETCYDCLKLLNAMESLGEYESQMHSIYVNQNKQDLYGLFTTLYQSLPAASPDLALLRPYIERIRKLAETSPYIDRQNFAARIIASSQKLPVAAEPEVKEAPASQKALVNVDQLTGSLKAILAYSLASDTFCDHFKKILTLYKKMADKNAIDDNSRKIRLEITGKFYELYSLVFFRSLKDNVIPLPVLMFLYFGYVDEQLAGMENAILLAQLATQLTAMLPSNVYTMYDWLKAIYDFKKEPSRNEFDQDYTDYIHALKISGKIDTAQELALSRNPEEKVKYELKNMFPTVNKITSGHIASFCPVFSSHNMLKALDTSFVSAASIQQILTRITRVDYSAFYREYTYTNMEVAIPKEFLHMEILPDFILTPCIGIRCSMWQEIEGRKRTTPARMALPIFYLEDLHSAVVRLVGEYRWEMCKRVQGARWNDVSERSLTSEYFDYIQFYKKNHELSADAKERIRAALLKAHNSFKEMFVRDYVIYILFEGAGSPRLNKAARTILFTYCPFSAEVRKTLAGNPLYKEMMDRYEIKKLQHLHKMELLEKRVTNTGNALPAELVDERIYLEK